MQIINSNKQSEIENHRRVSIVIDKQNKIMKEIQSYFNVNHEQLAICECKENLECESLAFFITKPSEKLFDTYRYL